MKRTEAFTMSESDDLLLRSQMLTALSDLVAGNRWTAAEAANRFKVGEPAVSDLMQGKISRFTTEALVSMQTNAGLAGNA